MSEDQQGRDNTLSPPHAQPMGRRSLENPQTTANANTFSGAAATPSNVYTQSRQYGTQSQYPAGVAQAASSPSNSYTYRMMATNSYAQSATYGRSSTQVSRSNEYVAPRAAYSPAEQHLEQHTVAAHNYALISAPYPSTGTPYYPQLPMHIPSTTAAGFPASPDNGPQGYISVTNSSYFHTAPSASSHIIAQIPSSSTHVVHRGHTNDHDGAGQSATAGILLCDICGATRFKRLHELNRHKASVHQPRQWTCDLCEKMFTRQDILKKHKRTVHGNALPLE